MDNTSATAVGSAVAKPAVGAEPEVEPSRAESEAAEPVAKTESAKAKAVEAKPAAKARVAKTEDAEPLMVELERAPLPSRAEARRAQAKRRFEEPPPRLLRFSFYFFVAAGLVWLATAVYFLINKQTIIDAQVASGENNSLTPDEIARALNQILWIFLIAGVVFAAFLGLFGYKATEGARRARTLVTIFAVILVIFHMFLLSTSYGTLSAMFALVGLVLLWMPSSRKYFPPRELS